MVPEDSSFFHDPTILSSQLPHFPFYHSLFLQSEPVFHTSGFLSSLPYGQPSADNLVFLRQLKSIPSLQHDFLMCSLASEASNLRSFPLEDTLHGEPYAPLAKCPLLEPGCRVTVETE